MPKNCGVGWPEKVVSCSEDEKGVQGGSGAYMNQVQRFSRGISGLVVEYIVAIDVTQDRFPADAHCSHELVRAGKAVRRGGAQKAETDSHMTARQLTCRFRRRHFKPMGSPRVGSNTTGVDL